MEHMNRKRDKFASWLGRRGRPRSREGTRNNDARRSERGVSPAAHIVGSEVGSREAESQKETPRPLWQRAWASLPLSDQRLIQKEVQNIDAGGDLFSDLERVAHEKSQELYDRQWNDRVHIPGRETETVRLRTATSRIITCLRRFKEVGDIAVSFDPTHAALPWAAFRFLLEVHAVLSF